MQKNIINIKEDALDELNPMILIAKAELSFIYYMG
jgi:hypothetical protein